MAHNWNWNDLRFTLAVAEAGSVNAAAARLNVNHATILRRIARFEEASGLTLFQRSPRGYRVDPGALAVMEALRGVGGAVEKLSRVARGEGERVSGPVQITSTDSLALSILPRLITQFGIAHPNVPLTLLSTNARLNLARMDADMTIRPGQAKPEGVISERVATMVMHIYGAPEYAARIAAGTEPDWLGVSELLSRSPSYAWQTGLPQERIVFRADSFVTLAAVARAGMGLTMLPDILAEGLVRIPEQDDALSVGIWVCAHQDLAQTPRIALCRRWFGEALAQEMGP
jgi:DNA-binding transcriptional LysR family regulator